MRRHDIDLGYRPYVRAIIISAALAVQGLSAIPTRSLDATLMARPEGIRATHWLTALLQNIGVATEPAAVERGLISLSGQAVATRNRLLLPLQPLLSSAAMSQQWGLFLGASDLAYRMNIEVRTSDDEWKRIYSVNREDALGLAKQLDYRRMRGIYNPKGGGPRSNYAAFTRWLANRLLQAHPDYQAVRVSMDRLTLATRGSPNRLLDTCCVALHERTGAP